VCPNPPKAGKRSNTYKNLHVLPTTDLHSGLIELRKSPGKKPFFSSLLGDYDQ
jgi:hypothetical protein